MLTKLLPDQISKFWTVISHAVQQSLPPTVGENPDKLNRILSAALAGKVDVWASYEKGDANRFEGLVLTRILYDDASDTRNLLLYCVYGYDKVSNESWANGFRALVKYANGIGCQQIIAYTDVPYLVELAKRLGGEAKYTFISFSVKRSLKYLIN